MLHPLVDFHCHLDLYQEYRRVYEECRRAEVEVLAVTTTPRAWAKNVELAAGAPNIRVGLGLHPQLVAGGVDELLLFKKLLRETIYVGEVGLDASPQFYRRFEEQKRVFREVLEACREEGGKILSVHSVRSVGEVLKMIEAYLPQNKGKAVLHWFTGTVSEAKRAYQLGCYFSINSEMLKTEQRRNTVAMLPRERILTETDGPFTIRSGNQSAPQDVIFALETLSILLNMSIEGLKSLIVSNLQRLEQGKL